MKAAIVLLLLAAGLSGCASSGRSKIDGGHKSIQSSADIVHTPASSQTSKIHILITPGSRTIVTGSEAMIEKDANGVIQFAPVAPQEGK